MSDARSFIDGFLQQRGYLPLQQRFGIVVGWHRAITRYLLHGDRLGEGAEKDPIVRDYRDALKFLQLTAEGKFSGAGRPGGQLHQRGPQVVTPGRTFSLDQLKDFDMSSAPFDHNLIIERLKDQVAVLASVGGAADFAAIKAVRDFRTPTAYVILAEANADAALVRSTPAQRPGRWSRCDSVLWLQPATTGTTRARTRWTIYARY
ncbi:DUF1320 family protein [Pseudomonas aeruginosa]|nr:DUF1320 family protein [Pseudomonas aeruginosa]